MKRIEPRWKTLENERETQRITRVMRWFYDNRPDSIIRRLPFDLWMLIAHSSNLYKRGENTVLSPGDGPLLNIVLSVDTKSLDKDARAKADAILKEVCDFSIEHKDEIDTTYHSYTASFQAAEYEADKALQWAHEELFLKVKDVLSFSMWGTEVDEYDVDSFTYFTDLSTDYIMTKRLKEGHSVEVLMWAAGPIEPQP